MKKVIHFIQYSNYGPFILIGIVISILIVDVLLFASNPSPKYEIVIIDGCEYIKTINSFEGNSSITHKANCPNHKK